MRAGLPPVGTWAPRVSAHGRAAFRRPTCAWAARAGEATGAPRFLLHNILPLTLEAPIRVTCDIGHPQAQVPNHLLHACVHVHTRRSGAAQRV